MAISPQERHRLLLHEAVHRGTPGDLEFYAGECLPEHRILELGCGTGRILGALPRGSVRVGLDRDGPKLQLGRERWPHVEFLRGDACSFSLGARFDRVLIPFNTLFALGGWAPARCTWAR